MLMISIPRERVPDLSKDGHKCRINGHQTTLRLEWSGPQGNRHHYLTYEDEAGILNRCKLLSSQPDGDVVHYMAASHGDDDEPHSIIRADHTGQPVSVLEDVAATTVIVSINGKQIAKGHFPHGTIDGLLAMGDSQAVANWGSERPWERAVYGIVTLVERGDIDPKAIMTTALWAVCRRDDAPDDATAIEDIARQGGNTIAVEIKTDAEGFDFRGRGYPTPRVVSREQARRLRQMGKDPTATPTD